MVVEMIRAIMAVALAIGMLGPPAGDIIIHTWLDANRDGLRQAAEPAVDAEIRLSYCYLGPEYAVTVRTGERGLVAIPGLVPGEYDVLVLRFNPGRDYIAPWYGYPGRVAIVAGESMIVLIPFWRWDTMVQTADQAVVQVAAQPVVQPITRPEMPPGLPIEWQGRLEAIGWFPYLERIEGLRCGKRLMDCGDIVQ